MSWIIIAIIVAMIFISRRDTTGINGIREGSDKSSVRSKPDSPPPKNPPKPVQKR